MGPPAISREDVIQDISPNDEMYDAATRGGLDHYFRVGESALHYIMLSLRSAHKSPGDVGRILDMPSGHGRVLRYLRSAFPAAEITACDLLVDAVDYCAKTFGAIPVYSRKDFTQIPLGDQNFDLIWVGSLLTHLDARLCSSFLETFSRRLRAGGILIFTTHGRLSYQWIAEGKHNYGLSDEQSANVLDGFESVGFSFTGAETERFGASYGLSFCSPNWVLERIARLPEIRLVHLAEAGWAQHQDLYACVREPQWNTSLRVHGGGTSSRRSRGALARLSRFIPHRLERMHRGG